MYICIKGLEAADRISQPDYKVTYTGEKSKSHFCSFGQAGVYNKQQSQRTKVKTDLAAINGKYESDSFKEALSPKAIIEKVSDLDEDTSNSKEPLEVLTNIVEEAYEAPGEWETILETSLKPKKKPLNFTYKSAIDADHFLRKELRIALGQRLLNTHLANDTGMSVELPVIVHTKKESFTDFKEPADFTYTKGLKYFLTNVLESIHQGLESCTESELQFIPVEQYKAAYTECFNNKIREMDEKYSNLSECERLKVYHALIITNSEQQNLESFIEMFMGISKAQEDGLGGYLTKNKNIAADLFRKSSEQKVGFIKTLAEFSSGECSTIFKRIEQQHVSMVNSFFIQIEDMTHGLNQAEKDTLLNLPSITRDLFHKYFDLKSQFLPVPESQKAQYISENVSPEEIDQVLYNHAECLGLTNIGNGYPRSVPVLNYQAQSQYLDDSTEKDVTKPLKKNTTKLTNLLNSTELIPHTGYKLPFAELLKACDVPDKVVNRLCYTDRLTTFEKVCDALTTGAIREMKGIGDEKIKKITNFITKYEHVVKQNPTIAAVDITAEMVNTVDITSEMGRYYL